MTVQSVGVGRAVTRRADATIAALSHPLANSHRDLGGRDNESDPSKRLRMVQASNHHCQEGWVCMIENVTLPMYPVIDSSQMGCAV